MLEVLHLWYTQKYIRCYGKDESRKIDFEIYAKRAMKPTYIVVLFSLSSFYRRVLTISMTISLVCKCNVAFGQVMDGIAKLGREKFGRSRRWFARETLRENELV